MVAESGAVPAVGEVVVTGPGMVVVGDVPAAVVATSATVVTDDAGTAVSDPDGMEEPGFSPVSDVHAAATKSTSAHRSTTRLRLGIFGSKSVQRHGDSPLTVPPSQVLEAGADRPPRYPPPGIPFRISDTGLPVIWSE